MKYNKLEEWLEFWQHEHGSQEIDLGLNRVNAVKELMGWEIKQPIIIVGGTNGKGSTCAFLTEIYHQAGYRVGTLSSPHIIKYNERICINGLPVDDETIVTAFDKIDQIRQDISLTYFEVNVLVAVEIFLAQNVDILILEVGLGGRLDAVNIFDADVMVVTNVDLDHQEYLGDTREKIGYEKAGIFRAAKPAIIGDRNPPQSMIDHLHKIGAIQFQFGKDYLYERLEQQWSFYFQPSHHDAAVVAHNRLALPIPVLRGSYQLANASHALCVIECLNKKLPVPIAAIKQGLLLVIHPGRFQILPGRPLVVLDVGHNPHAMRALKRDLKFLPYTKKRLAVFSILADKDLDAILEILRDDFSEWHIATLNTSRAQSCDKIEESMQNHGISKVYKYDSILAAYQHAIKNVEEEDQIIVFGSFYTVAEVMNYLKEYYI